MRRLLVCMLFASFAGAGAVDGAVIYREVFPNDSTTTNRAISTVEWNLHRGASAAALTGTNDVVVSFSTGSLSGTDAVNSHDSALSDTQKGRGYLSILNSSGAPYFAWTSEHSFDLAANPLDTISWYQGNSTASNAYRAAIRIDGSWYISQAAAEQASGVGSAGEFAAKAVLRTIDVGDATWSVLNFTAGSTLSIGTVTTLPTTGTVDGYGLYAPTRSGTLRFDVFEVNVVPEPSALAAVAGAGLMLVRRGRRPAR